MKGIIATSDDSRLETVLDVEDIWFSVWWLLSAVLDSSPEGPTTLSENIFVEKSMSKSDI